MNGRQTSADVIRLILRGSRELADAPPRPASPAEIIERSKKEAIPLRDLVGKAGRPVLKASGPAFWGVKKIPAARFDQQARSGCDDADGGETNC